MQKRMEKQDAGDWNAGILGRWDAGGKEVPWNINSRHFFSYR
jgi:hypothetical protein